MSNAKLKGEVKEPYFRSKLAISFVEPIQLQETNKMDVTKTFLSIIYDISDNFDKEI